MQPKFKKVNKDTSFLQIGFSESVSNNRPIISPQLSGREWAFMIPFHKLRYLQTSFINSAFNLLGHKNEILIYGLD